MGGLLEYDSEYVLPAWLKLDKALRTGKPTIGVKGSQELFDATYADPERLRTFLRAMTGVSSGPAREIAAKFPWSDYETFVDIGTAQGGLPVQIALKHKHLKGAGLDLPIVKPVFEEYVRSFGLERQLRFVSADFFKDPLEKTEVFVMGHILHDWDLEKKRFLIKKAFSALPSNGALLVYESVIDDQRRRNTGGFLGSLNMLVQTREGLNILIGTVLD
jgi:O-methyltransferase domain